MIHTKICAECETLLDDAIIALRQHRVQMSTGISLINDGNHNWLSQSDDEIRDRAKLQRRS
jgi:hypothetical protein